MTEEKEVVQEQIPVQEEQVKEQIEVKEEPRKEEVKEDEQQINWKKANEAMKLQQQKIAELEARIAESEKPAPIEEKDEFAELDPEEYLTVDKARKFAEKLAEKKGAEAAKKIVGEYMKQQVIQNDEQRMRSKFEDYDYVIENYAVPLIKNDPALAYQVQNSKNPAETAYRLGKLSDSYEESTMKQQTNPKAEKIMKNASRPVSGAAAGSPLKSQADNFSKMSQQQVWEMSQKYARGA